MLRMKRVNLQHSSYKHVFLKSILVENNVDPDQTASLLPKRIQSVKHEKVKVSPTRVLFVPKVTKGSINPLADPEYSVITKPADSPDQTASLGADCSWIISFAHVT